MTIFTAPPCRSALARDRLRSSRKFVEFINFYGRFAPNRGQARSYSLR